MGKAFLFNILTLSLSSFSFSQATIFWEPDITVADGTIYGNQRPRITLTSNNSPVVVFGKSGTGVLFSAKWNGSTFNSPVPLLPSGMASYLSYWTGPDVAAKGDTIIAVFKAMPMDTGNVYTVRSIDGGLAYSDTIGVNSYTTGMSWMPAMGMDDQGNPTVVYMAYDSGDINPRWVVVHSNDAGVSYENEMEVANTIPDEACDCCPAEYVINGDDEVMLYRNNDANIRDIYAVHSTDGGNTFPYYENVDNLGWNVSSCPSTGPDGIIQNSNLITTYASRQSGHYRVYLSNSTLSGGVAFDTRTMISSPTNVNGTQNYPRISNQGDTMVMVWQESETSNYEIFCGYTVNGSITEIVNSKHQVNSSNTGLQTNPDVEVKDGYVHLVYQDAASGDVIYKRGIIGNLGVEPLTTQKIEIAPNPSKDGCFTIINAENPDSKIMIVDAKGRNIPFEQNGSSIRLSETENGMYFLIRTNSTDTTTHKIILEK